MNHDHDTKVRERHEDLCFEELSGTAAPPDRSVEIAARITAGRTPRLTSRPRRFPVLAAAIVLLAVSVTVGVALLRSDRRADGRDEASRTSIPATLPVVQDPKPAPKEQGGKEKGGTPSPKPVTTGAEGQVEKTQEPAADKAQRPPRPKPEPDKVEHPKGTDPQDLAAVRSAEAMLEAEKRLAEQIKAGKFKGIDLLPFETLQDWKYTDGLEGMPKAVRWLSGKRVMMTGFMLPIDEVKGMKEFLLVASLWSCCYGTPPDIHGVVRVVMPKGEPIDYRFDPVKVVGTFKVEATVMDGYVVDIYQLHAESVSVID